MRADQRSTKTSLRLLLAGWLVLCAAASTNAAETDARQQLVAQAKSRLLRDVDELERYLSRGGQQVLLGWREYLQLDAIREELKQAEPDGDRLTDVWHRFFAAQDGLHHEQFLRVRDSLRHYRVVASTPEGDLRALQDEAFQRLEQQIAAYQASDSRADAHAIGTTLAWLEATGADKTTIAKTRKTFGHSNAYIRVSSRLANHFLTRPVYETERVSASIGGAQTTGDAVTRGTLWMHTSPASDYGAIDIRLSGTTTTNNSVAQRGRITIYGGAQTTIDARVRLSLREDQLRVDAPQVHATTKSYITDIEANRRFIERLAWRRAPRELPNAEQAAARQVEQRLSERLGKETAKLMKQANGIYADKVRKPMTRRGAWPKLRYFSDADSLHLRLYQVAPYQVAAPNGPPQWPVEGDLTMTGHESMFENLFENVYGGREIKDTQFLYLMELLTGESPRPLWVHDREPRWSVIMTDERPLRVRFRHEQLEMTLAVKETLRGKERYDVPALMTAKFQVAATTDGPVFTRLGNVQVEFPEREKHSKDAEKLRAFLSRKFSAIMPASLYFDGLAAPAGGFGDKLNQLELKEVAFESGWATLRYQLNLKKQPKAVLVNTTGLGG